jgi:hypothetical protein
MLVSLRGGFEHLGADLGNELRGAALHHIEDGVRAHDRELLAELGDEVLLGRIGVRRLQTLGKSVLAREEDDAPVGESRNGEPRHAAERVAVLERGREHGARLGEKREAVRRALSVRDVAQVADEERRTRRPDLGDRELDRKLGPVRVRGRQLQPLAEDPRPPARQVAFAPAPVLVSEGRGNDDVGDVAADDVLAPVPERPLGRRIELDDPPLGVHADDAVERGLDDGALARLALAERLLGVLPLEELGDLARDRGHHAEQLGVRLPDVPAEELRDP